MSTTEPTDAAALIVRFAETDWADETQGAQASAELVAEAAKVGAGRKRMLEGARGFHSTVNVMPAGFEVPPHSHSHDEVFVVLEGGCQLDNGEHLGRFDHALVPGGTRYGFTCGPDGMTFLVLRTAEAAVTF